MITVAKKKYYGVNEAVVKSLNTIEMNVDINHSFYEKFKGSGILVCTKTGSTGFAKNLNGSIIMPSVNAIEFLEIAPTVHVKNLSVRSPLILSDNTTVSLSNFISSQQSSLIVDGVNVRNLKQNDQIDISMCKSNFKILFYKNEKDYIKKLQKTFIQE